jgi:hypothetical protein
VSSSEVRLVLDHARPNSNRQWADFFGVHLRTIEAWRSRGLVLDLWASPKQDRWDALKAEAIDCLWNNLQELQRTPGQ